MMAPDVAEAIRALAADGKPPSEQQVRAWLRKLSPAKQGAVDSALGLAPPESFREYVARHDPDFGFHKWTDPVFDALQGVADGSIDRLIIEAPPRSGKSHIVSVRFPSYYLERHGHRWVALGSHGARLAQKFSREARRFFRRAGGRINPEMRSVQEWGTAGGGGLWITSPDSSGTGRGSSLFVIDDPVKSRKAIRTLRAQQDLIEWYEDVAYSRLEDVGAIVLMATRWGDYDLTGQVLAKETASASEADEIDAASEHWMVISRPARMLPPEERVTFPPSVRVVPDTREVGQALVPERGYDEARLAKIERVVGPASWWSLWQQSPRQRTGTLFAWENFRIVDATHAQGIKIRAWDLAGTEGGGDWTVGTLMSYAPDSPVPIIIEDVVRFQHGPAKRNAKMQETAFADMQRYGQLGFMIWFEDDVGIAGGDRTRALVALLAGFHVSHGRASGSKLMRADPLSGQVEVGNVGLLKGPWNNAFRLELTSFTGKDGEIDDQVDSAAHAFNRLFELTAHAEGEEYFAPR